MDHAQQGAPLTYHQFRSALKGQGYTKAGLGQAWRDYQQTGQLPGGGQAGGQQAPAKPAAKPKQHNKPPVAALGLSQPQQGQPQSAPQAGQKTLDHTAHGTATAHVTVAKPAQQSKAAVGDMDGFQCPTKNSAHAQQSTQEQAKVKPTLADPAGRPASTTCQAKRPLVLAATVQPASQPKPHAGAEDVYHARDPPANISSWQVEDAVMAAGAAAAAAATASAAYAETLVIALQAQQQNAALGRAPAHSHLDPYAICFVQTQAAAGLPPYSMQQQVNQPPALWPTAAPAVNTAAQLPTPAAPRHAPSLEQPQGLPSYFSDCNTAGPWPGRPGHTHIDIPGPCAASTQPAGRHPASSITSTYYGQTHSYGTPCNSTASHAVPVSMAASGGMEGIPAGGRHSAAITTTNGTGDLRRSLRQALSKLGRAADKAAGKVGRRVHQVLGMTSDVQGQQYSRAPTPAASAVSGAVSGAAWRPGHPHSGFTGHNSACDQGAVACGPVGPSAVVQPTSTASYASASYYTAGAAGAQGHSGLHVNSGVTHSVSNHLQPRPGGHAAGGVMYGSFTSPFRPAGSQVHTRTGAGSVAAEPGVCKALTFIAESGDVHLSVSLPQQHQDQVTAQVQRQEVQHRAAPPPHTSPAPAPGTGQHSGGPAHAAAAAGGAATQPAGATQPVSSPSQQPPPAPSNGSPQSRSQGLGESEAGSDGVTTRSMAARLRATLRRLTNTSPEKVAVRYQQHPEPSMDTAAQSQASHHTYPAHPAPAKTVPAADSLQQVDQSQPPDHHTLQPPLSSQPPVHPEQQVQQQQVAQLHSETEQGKAASQGVHQALHVGQKNKGVLTKLERLLSKSKPRASTQASEQKGAVPQPYSSTASKGTAASTEERHQKHIQAVQATGGHTFSHTHLTPHDAVTSSDLKVMSNALQQLMAATGSNTAGATAQKAAPPSAPAPAQLVQGTTGKGSTKGKGTGYDPSDPSLHPSVAALPACTDKRVTDMWYNLRVRARESLSHDHDRLFKGFGPWIPVGAARVRDARMQVPRLPGIYEWAACPPGAKAPLIGFYLGKAGRLQDGRENLRTRFHKYTQVGTALGHKWLGPHHEGGQKDALWYELQRRGFSLHYRFCVCTDTEPAEKEAMLLKQVDYASNLMLNGVRRQLMLPGHTSLQEWPVIHF